jgi:hypothetical protein
VDSPCGPCRHGVFLYRLYGGSARTFGGSDYANNALMRAARCISSGSGQVTGSAGENSSRCESGKPLGRRGAGKFAHANMQLTQGRIGNTSLQELSGQ